MYTYFRKGIQGSFTGEGKIERSGGTGFLIHCFNTLKFGGDEP
jgi:hypothetical protein